jgi:hypothetical protein
LDTNYHEEKCQERKIGRIQRKAKEGVLVVTLTPAVAQEKLLRSATQYPLSPHVETVDPTGSLGGLRTG